MTAIVTLFWRICTFKGGPEAVPANNLFLAITILANGVISLTAAFALNMVAANTLLAENVSDQVDAADFLNTTTGLTTLTQVVVNQAAMAGLIWLILNLMGFTARFSRTLGAAFGTDIILTTVSALVLCVAMWINPLLTSLAFLAMTFWTIGTFGFIFHRALEIRFGFGILVAIFVTLFSIAISQAAIAA